MADAVRSSHRAGIAVGCALAVAGCGVGVGASSSASGNIGDAIQQSFISTLDNATSGNGTTSYSVEFTIYRCDDQTTGVPLDQLTGEELQNAQGAMLFHCALTRDVSSAYASAPSGSDGWLYYLEVRGGGKWDAKWQPLPVTTEDQIPPCSGAVCNLAIGKGPPNEVAGDEASGHVVTSGHTSSAPTAGTGTAQLTRPGSGSGAPPPTSPAPSTTSTSATVEGISVGETKAQIERQFGRGEEPGHGAGCAYKTAAGTVIVEYGVTRPDGSDASCNVPSLATAKKIYP